MILPCQTTPRPSQLLSKLSLQVGPVADHAEQVVWAPIKVPLPIDAWTVRFRQQETPLTIHPLLRVYWLNASNASGA